MKYAGARPTAQVDVATVADLMTYFAVTGAGAVTANIQLRPGTNVIGIRNTGMSTTLNLTGPPGATATYRYNLEQGSNMLQTVNVNRINS